MKETGVLNLRLIKITGCLLVMLLCVSLFSCAGAETGGLFLFRIRPQISAADMEREDGSLQIGAGPRRKQLTAQLLIGTEGRSPEGDTRDLVRLIREHSGSVKHAWWRLEARNPAKIVSQFLLRPDSGDLKELKVSATAGWNLWNLTGWIGEMLSSGEDCAFSIRVAKNSHSAELDIRRSWIYVSLWLEDPPPGLLEYRITDSELLDIALSALPEGHWALKQYQEVAGSLTRPLWPEAGAPYYFGGHSEEKVLYHRYFPLQESRYYKPDKLYLCGFDCGSFLHWVEEKAGYLPHDSLSTVLRHRASLFPMAGQALRDWNQALQPGDLIVFNHGSLHTGMFLGTPRMFGLTAENAPEIADWLDAPMMIHCGEDPFCYDRFKAYIESSDFRMTTYPPDGGVTVSLLVPDIKDAPHIREAPWDKEYGFFTVLGQPMTVFPLNDCTELAWLRPVSE